MAKSQQSFNKKEKEKKRRKKKKEKEERRAQRKAEREERGPLSFEDMLSYVDENGNVTSTPPDPSKKKEIKVEDIQLGAASQYRVEEDPIRNGRVKFFNEEKGYGFIIDDSSKDSIFVHINDLPGPLNTNDKVTFETENGFKGLKAVRVKLVN